MKKFALMLLSAVISMAICLCTIMLDMRDNVVFTVSIFGGVLIAALLGVFNTEKRKPRRRMSYWRHLDDYRQAA